MGAVRAEFEILGHARVRVRIATSEPVAYLSAKLCDVFPDGTSSLVARNILNLTHRDSAEQPPPMLVGELVDVELEIGRVDDFEAGHALRLDLAGTDWPNTWSPPRPVTFTIDRADDARAPGDRRPEPDRGAPGAAAAPPQRPRRGR